MKTKKDSLLLHTPNLEKCSKTKAVIYAKDVGDWRVWKKVLARSDLSLREVIAYSKRLGDYNVAETVIERADFQEHIRKISEVEAISCIQEMIVAKEYFDLKIKKN